MSEESPKFDFYKKIITAVILAVLLIIRWIEAHPFTAVWMLAAAIFLAYLFMSAKNNGSGPPGDFPPNDHY